MTFKCFSRTTVSFIFLSLFIYVDIVISIIVPSILFYSCCFLSPLLSHFPQISLHPLIPPTYLPEPILIPSLKSFLLFHPIVFRGLSLSSSIHLWSPFIPFSPPLLTPTYPSFIMTHQSSLHNIIIITPRRAPICLSSLTRTLDLPMTSPCLLQLSPSPSNPSLSHWIPVVLVWLSVHWSECCGCSMLLNHNWEIKWNDAFHSGLTKLVHSRGRFILNSCVWSYRTTSVYSCQIRHF